MLFACHDDISVLPRGATYGLKCEKCCTHDFGSWVISEGYQSYKEGFITRCCMGCGMITDQFIEEVTPDADGEGMA